MLPYRPNSKIKQAPESPQFPQVETENITAGAGYLPSRELQDAVNVALILGMPLLLTGAPGSGKTRLANNIAWNLTEDLIFEFPVKSKTESRDLYYSFDTLGRYHDGNSMPPSNFISYNALGLAMLYAQGKEAVNPDIVPKDLIAKLPLKGRRSVVLIDEIDKAGRDVPNDLLDELDQLRFNIPELQRTEVALDKNQKRSLRPIVVITSNAERSLPPPFLRRCVYYNIPFPPFEDDVKELPEEAVTIEKIVLSRMGVRYQAGDRLLGEALDLFRKMRDEKNHIQTRPSVAQLLNWLYALSKLSDEYSTSDLPHGSLKSLTGQDRDSFVVTTKCTLFTSDVDQEAGAKLIRSWLG